MKIQPIFNNQKWGRELERLGQVKSKLDSYLKGRLSVEILPSLYTDFKDIPFAKYVFPMATAGEPQTADAPSPTWYLDTVYPLLGDDVDIPLFICTPLDWKDNDSSDGYTEAYTHIQYPPTFPPFMSYVSAENDKSGRHPEQYRLEANVPHELGHQLFPICGMPDRTHEFDYSGRTQEMFDSFDYEKIKVALTLKRKLSGRMQYFYTRAGDQTVYMLIEGVMTGVSTNMEALLKDWPQAKEIKLSLDEFGKYKLANWHTIAKRA